MSPFLLIANVQFQLSFETNNFSEVCYNADGDIACNKFDGLKHYMCDDPSQSHFANNRCAKLCGVKCSK